GIINCINGYVDMNAWYDKDPFENIATHEIPIEYNPFTEPIYDISDGKTGNDANWVLWYLWRFGKLTDSKGQPDTTKINGIFDNNTEQKVKEVQAVLGLVPDGIVGKITRSVWKKIC
ncbi:MAG: peptidoglycan-binding protein, partial [Lachnospiraceae bacterium]|nr:peptidoglycan-binding protein [Lachnospiraceae bacterium]